MTITRRETLAGLGSATAVAGFFDTAHAASSTIPAAVLKHPGYRGWSPPEPNRGPIPFDLEVTLPGGERKTLRQWLGGKPAVLSLWATWCPPCMVEKPVQAQLEARLQKAGVRARIKALQAFDNVSLAKGVAFARKLGAGKLDVASAGEPMERAFLDVFGRSPVQDWRTSMPSLLLLSSQGVELGRAQGAMATRFGGSYWERKSTFEFLSALDTLA